MRTRFRLLKIMLLSVAIVFALWTNGGLKISLDDTAFAVGDLTVDWGVPEGDPIFEIQNMAPGDMEERSVSVTNDGPNTRSVSVRGEKTSETGDFSEALEIVISEGLSDIYGGTSPTGPKSLEDFFAESQNAAGMFLSDLSSGGSTTYLFKVTFREDSGDEFQNAQLVFDLVIGISTELPDECGDIEFDGDPIFGTSAGDNIVGTPGNDLIFGLEGGDAINGLSGDDCILGGDGSDSLKGNNGNDVLLGQAGSDSLKGENGQDFLSGGDGSDSLDGGNEEDVLEGGNESDSLKGGNGDDRLSGGDGSDSLKGDNGDDFLDGGLDSDALNGGPATDECINGEAYTNCEIF